MSTVKGTFQCLAKKIFENDANETYLCQQKDLEKRAQETLANTYLEKDPTTREWASQFLPTSHGVSQYLHNLFPSAAWIVRYNRRWLMGDAIAGTSSCQPF
jgi:sodium-independent sulfate anion transporter 11